MSFRSSDQLVADLVFKDQGWSGAFVVLFLAVMVLTPLSVPFYQITGGQLGASLAMHSVLAVVGVCCVWPFAWLREAVFMRSVTLQRRYGHLVNVDEMECRLRESFLDDSIGSRTRHA